MLAVRNFTSNKDYELGDIGQAENGKPQTLSWAVRIMEVEFNALTPGHENIRAGFIRPQCYAKVNTI
jgi:hypothetical protein